MDHEPAGAVPATEAEVISDLRARLREAQETLDAIRDGEVDAVLVKQSGSSKIFTLVNADQPYRFLIEQMKEGAVTLSEEGVVLYGNRRLGEMLGEPLEKIVGSNIKRFFKGDGLARFNALLAGLGTEPSRAELHMQRLGQAAVPVYISLNHIVSEAGAPRLIGGVFSDLTQQHELEARFSQARKMEAMAQLSGGLAHDFNNVLQAICASLNLIKSSTCNMADIGRWAETGLSAAIRGTKLTSQLLAFSTIHKINVQPVDLSALIGGMASQLSKTLGAEIRIDYQLERTGVHVLADKAQLELAILNVATNARDAMRHGGTLQISTRLRVIREDPELAAGEYLDLSIADSGCGMSDNVRTHAFNPFFTTKEVGQGSGLGLAQVYGIARQAGGSARIVDSAAPGTTLSLLLRQSPSAAAASGCAAPSETATAARPQASILVVDDDDDVRELLVEALAMQGYRVSQAAGGDAALAIMARARPDVLVTDYLMPKMNGAELVRTCRDLGYEMPVIFATGYARTDALNQSVGLKATVLLKPFSLEELTRLIEEALAVRTDRPWGIASGEATMAG